MGLKGTRVVEQVEVARTVKAESSQEVFSISKFKVEVVEESKKSLWKLGAEPGIYTLDLLVMED
jgi:hypothetical protein